MLFKKYKISEGPFTHLLLNGGKLRVDPDKELSFIEEYAQALTDGKKVFVSECRPSTFRYMIDVDIIDEEYWETYKIKTLVKELQSVIFDFYEKDLNVICCSVPSKVTDNGIKTGLHLIWPRHFVNSNEALFLREAIIQKLENFEFKPKNSWEDVIDRLIYTQNGFRMVGSDKWNHRCEAPENREYHPSFIMDSKGTFREEYLKRLGGDIKALILDTSIRLVPDALKNLQLTDFTSIPSWVKTDQIQTKQKSKPRYKANRALSAEEKIPLEKFIHEQLPDCYKCVRIREMKRYPDNNILIIPTTNYCMNIEREHNSCGIYFFATPRGLYQKCLCPCDTLKGRVFGYCKDYTSSCFEFPETLKLTLFPELILQNNQNKYGKPQFIKTPKKKKKEKPIELNLSATLNKKTRFKNQKSFCDNIFDSL